jgi:hypothetical protein
MGDGRGEHSDLVLRPDGKRPFERPRRRWESNIIIDLQVILLQAREPKNQKLTSDGSSDFSL